MLCFPYATLGCGISTRLFPKSLWRKETICVTAFTIIKNKLQRVWEKRLATDNEITFYNCGNIMVISMVFYLQERRQGTSFLIWGHCLVPKLKWLQNESIGVDITCKSCILWIQNIHMLMSIIQNRHCYVIFKVKWTE